MFAYRQAMVWGLLLLTITPALAQSVDDSESQPRPFHDASITSFEGVWREPTPRIERRISEVAQHTVELVAAEETVTPGQGEAAATTPVADMPRLLPTLTGQPSDTLAQLPSLTDTIRVAETGLLEWFLGMLGVVGLVALGGVYWIYHIRPALDVRHATSRLRLSSTLLLPRRSGLFLVDVEDQTVLVAMDGGGIRQVVPLGQGASKKTTGRRTAADKAQFALSPSTSEGAQASEEVAFHDVYQERRARGGAVRAVLSAAKSAARPQTAAAHSHKAS